MTRLGRYVEYGIGGFKYVIAVFMMYAGIATIVAPIEPISGSLGFIYNTRFFLALFGSTFFLCGLTLFMGKIRKDKTLVGYGLMSIYCCFLFFGITNCVVYGLYGGIGNLIMAAITGALWLRWKFKTAYINPNHFKRQVNRIQNG